MVNKGNGPERIRTGEGRELGEKAVIYLLNYLLPDLKWWYFSKQGVFFFKFIATEL